MLLVNNLKYLFLVLISVFVQCIINKDFNLITVKLINDCILTDHLLKIKILRINFPMNSKEEEKMKIYNPR